MDLVKDLSLLSLFLFQLISFDLFNYHLGVVLGIAADQALRPFSELRFKCNLFVVFQFS